VASLSEYTMSAHPEIDMIYFAFCNLYNFYLTLVGCLKTPFGKKTIGRFLVWASAYPVFHGIGLAYRVIPDVDALLSTEITLLDNFSCPHCMGLWWPPSLTNYSLLFFRYWDPEKFVVNLVNPAAGLSTPVFYTGQFSLVMVFALFFFLLLTAYQRFSRRPISCIQNIKLPDLWFFFPMLLFLAWNMPMGGHSFLDTLMKMTGFVRIHSIDRMNMFFYFIILVNALLGLNWVLKLRSFLIFNLICLFYFFCLIVVYSIPAITPFIPDKIGLDITVFAAVYIVISFKIFQNKFPLGLEKIPQYKHEWIASTCQLVFGIALIAIALTSYLTICEACKKYVVEYNNTTLRQTREKLYLPFRSALVQYRNNQHDQASLDFLDQWTQRFLNHFKLQNWPFSNVQKDLRFVQKLEKQILATEKHIEKLEKQLLSAEKYLEFERAATLRGLIRDESGAIASHREHIKKEKEYFKFRKSVEKVSSKQELFELVAPTLDNYYWDHVSIFSLFLTSSPYYTSLSLQMWTALQYYLPDKYQLLAFFSGANTPKLLPLGKNSELTGAVGYSASGGLYPGVDIQFHLRALHPDSLKIVKDTNYDYFAQPLNPDTALKTKNFKKLFNIYGFDYLIFQNHTIKSKMQDRFIDMGFEPWNTPKTYRFEPRVKNAYNLTVFHNPQSYGKAYIANWVRTIKPSENLARRSFWELPKAWPQSQELVDNFDRWIAEIPDNIQGAAIIEVTEPKRFTKKPIQTGPQKSSVDIVKIIASKAVFDVDCLEDTCWFVYNSTALKGWQAYSGSEKLPIHKANLGFLSVPLEKGRQLVWFEYRSYSGIIGFIITCGGWIFVFLTGVLRYRILHTSFPSRSEVLGNA